MHFKSGIKDLYLKKGPNDDLKWVETCRPTERNNIINKVVFDWYLILFTCIYKHFRIASTKFKMI